MTPPFYPPPANKEVLKVVVSTADLEDEICLQLAAYRLYYGEPRKVLVSSNDRRCAFQVEGIICEPREYVPAGSIWVLG